MDKALMLLLLIVVIWGILVATGEGNLPSLLGARATENPLAQTDSEDLNGHNPASEPISEASFSLPPVNSANASLPLLLVWEGADEAYLGQSPILVEVNLMGGQALGTLTLEVLIPVECFQVQDMNGEQDGIQVQPGELAGAVVKQNEVNAEGLLRYQVSGLGESDVPARNVLTLSLIPVATGVAEVNLQAATATAPAGDALDIEILQPIKLIEIHEATTVATPVPTAAPTEVAETGDGELAGVYYRIQQGENLFRLALRFGCTAEEIAAANGITEMYSVPAGKVLRIPVPPPQGQAAYVVSAGETLYEIAHAFDLAVETLAAENDIPAPYHIQKGQWLVLQPRP